MSHSRVEPRDANYPSALRDRLGNAAPARLYAMGDPAVLRNRLLGLVCSIRCPGSIVIKTFDAIRALRDAGVVMIGGFHSPMERECLDILLRGAQPVILCAAKGLPGLRLGNAARHAIDAGRMLVLSPFGDDVRRTTAAQAVQRNNLVSAMAEAILVPQAAPGGKTWTTVHDALARGQAVLTFDEEANTGLIDAGVKPVAADQIAELVAVHLCQQYCCVRHNQTET